jgi:hypothetical protein
MARSFPILSVRTLCVLAAAALASMTGCGGSNTDSPRSDIRDGDLDTLTVAATYYVTFVGGYSLDHNYDLDVDCPTDPAHLDDRKDSGTVSQADVNQGHLDLDIWFVGRSACRSAGALLAAAKTDLAGIGYADSTQSFTRIWYRLKGGTPDSLRIPKDAIRDSASYPRLTRLIRDLQAALEP